MKRSLITLVVLFGLMMIPVIYLSNIGKTTSRKAKNAKAAVHLLAEQLKNYKETNKTDATSMKEMRVFTQSDLAVFHRYHYLFHPDENTIFFIDVSKKYSLRIDTDYQVHRIDKET